MLQSIKVVTQELCLNLERVVRIARYENKAKNQGTFFGVFWNLLNPALQIFVYWLVFSSGFRGMAPRDGYPYAVWLTLGVLPWTTMNMIMNASTTSLSAASGLIKNISIPLSIIPFTTVISNGLIHLWSMLVMFAVLFLSGAKPSWYMLEVIYFTLAGGFLMVGLSLIFSSLNVIFKDFQKFLQPVLRLLMYVSAVIVPLENFPETTQKIFRLNPLTYVVEGYRYCLIYNTGILPHWERAVYFWVFSIIVFILGCCIHMKLRKQFIDLV